MEINGFCYIFKKKRDKLSKINFLHEEKTFLSGFFNVDYSLASFYGGTSLLIIVGVALDTLQQIESHLVMRHYDSFLKSGKIKGRDRRR